MSESLLLDVPPPFVRTAYAKDGHPQKPFHYGTYLRFGATFLAGFLLCLLLMLVLVHTKPPTQRAPSATEGLEAEKMTVHDTVKSAGNSVLHAIGFPSAHPSHVKSLHLVGRNGMDYGPLVPISAPAFISTFSSPYPARSFTVHDKDMDCFATYNYAGQYGAYPYGMSAYNGYGSPDPDWLTRDELSFGLLRQMVLAIDPIPSPNPYTGSTQQSGIFLSFSSKDCTGTPLFDIAQPYSVQMAGSDIMLDFCYGVQTQEPSSGQVAQVQLRAFKFVEPKRKIHVSAPKSYCVFAPKPLPALNGTRNDYRLCDKCLQVKSLAAHPIWVELVDVTQNLPVQMPKKPVALRWK